MAERTETRRKKIVSVKVFSDEFEMLQKLAKKDHQTVSEFIRQNALRKQREWAQAGQWA